MTIRDSAALLLSLGIALAPLRVEAGPAAPAAATTSTASSASTGSSAATPAASTPPAGDDKAANLKRAEELFRNGERLYTEGSYESAILAFQECYELSKEPQLLYNIGNAYERLGDFANSRRYLDQYRAFAPEKEREALSRRIQALDQRQREKEQKEREAARDPANNPNKVDPQPGPGTQPTTPPVEPAKKERIYGPAAIALTAGVALGLGLGVGFGVTAMKQKQSALDGCADNGGTLYCSAVSEDFLAKRKLNALVADIGFAVAGAAAIGLITVLVLKANRKNKTQGRAGLAPYGGPRGAGMTFSLKF